MNLKLDRVPGGRATVLATCLALAVVVCGTVAWLAMPDRGGGEAGGPTPVRTIEGPGPADAAMRPPAGPDKSRATSDHPAPRELEREAIAFAGQPLYRLHLGAGGRNRPRLSGRAVHAGPQAAGDHARLPGGRSAVRTFL